MKRWSFGRAVGIAAAATMIIAAASGCTEKLDGSSGCPLTCTGGAVQIQTVTLDAVQSDTTVLGGLGLGSAAQMLLASRGDTLDTRVIIRFDTLPTTSLAAAKDTAVKINYLNDAKLRLLVDSGAYKVGVPVTVSVYDVDDSTAVDDTSRAALVPLFTPSRLIVAYQFQPGAVVDSITIPLPSAFLLQKAEAHARLRLGLQVSASKSVMFRVGAQDSQLGALLSMRTSPDTTVPPIVLSPKSNTPTNNASISGKLGDFTLVVKGTPPPPLAGTLTVGGLPGTRAYLLFNVPPAISDSSLVVAATLVLTQEASASPDPLDSMSVQPYLVLAGPAITDPARAAQITAPATVLGLTPLLTPPGSSGVREIQIGPAFSYWSLQSAALLPRAIVLESTREDYSPQQSFFYSSSAAPALRPKLRISYTPRSRVGVP